MGSLSRSGCLGWGVVVSSSSIGSGGGSDFSWFLVDSEIFWRWWR